MNSLMKLLVIIMVKSILVVISAAITKKSIFTSFIKMLMKLAFAMFKKPWLINAEEIIKVIRKSFAFKLKLKYFSKN